TVISALCASGDGTVRGDGVAVHANQREPAARDADAFGRKSDEGHRPVSARGRDESVRAQHIAHRVADVHVAMDLRGIFCGPDVRSYACGTRVNASIVTSSPGGASPMWRFTWSSIARRIRSASE